MTLPQVFCIVLNWNNAPDTLACLESLTAITYPNARILVVDNGSTDDSIARIRARFPELELLETGHNLGYAGGNNVGIRHALDQGAEAVCILNNDIIVDPGFLELLVSEIAETPRQGVTTPLIADHAAPDRVWSLGAALRPADMGVVRLHERELVDQHRGRPPFEAPIAPGSAMLVTRAVCEQVGLMDEAYFLYFEEIDWCLRINGAGFAIKAVPASTVWHKVSSSLGPQSPLVDYYNTRNHLRLVLLHQTGWRRIHLLSRIVLRNLLAILAFTAKSHHGRRLANRNARLVALRDALLHRWGMWAGGAFEE